MYYQDSSLRLLYFRLVWLVPGEYYVGCIKSVIHEESLWNTLESIAHMALFLVTTPEGW